MHRPGEIMYDKKRLIRDGMSHARDSAAGCRCAISVGAGGLDPAVRRQEPRS